MSGWVLLRLAAVFLVLAALAATQADACSLVPEQRRAAADSVGAGTRVRRCAPRGELKPELLHQYSLAQVDGIVKHIKTRLDQLSSSSSGSSSRKRPKQVAPRTSPPPAPPRPT